MRSAARQDWTAGKTVKVGFLTLTVVAKVATPGNWLPDQYALTNGRGVFYKFVPHNGVERVSSLAQAMAW